MRLDVGSIEVTRAVVTLDDGRRVEITGGGEIRVSGGYLREYSFALPSVDTVALACDAREDAHRRGVARVTVEFDHPCG